LKEYNVRGTPNTFFIDKDGKIYKIRRGALQEGELLKIIEELLKR
jgi:thioredoxin-related protein